MFGWIARLLRGLWGAVRHLGAAAPWLLLSFVLVLAGLVLVLLGFDLGDVDRWIAAQGDWLDAIGSLLFRTVCALAILICVVTIGSALFDRDNPERPGLGCTLLALAIAYFAWFGVTSG